MSVTSMLTTGQNVSCSADNLERIAKEANIPLREALAAKAGPNILTVLSRHPSAPDAELKHVLLENFSNVGHNLRSKPLLEKDETIRKQTHCNTQLRIRSSPRCSIQPET